MSSNFRWHHVGEPDNELPESGNDLIVRCANGEVLKTNYELSYSSGEKFAVAYYDDDYENNEFWTREGDAIVIFRNVAAWCYLKDVYEQLNNTGWGFDPDREANDADNT